MTTELRAEGKLGQGKLGGGGTQRGGITCKGAVGRRSNGQLGGNQRWPSSRTWGRGYKKKRGGRAPTSKADQSNDPENNGKSQNDFTWAGDLSRQVLRRSLLQLQEEHLNLKKSFLMESLALEKQ